MIYEFAVGVVDLCLVGVDESLCVMAMALQQKRFDVSVMSTTALYAVVELVISQLLLQ